MIPALVLREHQCFENRSADPGIISSPSHRTILFYVLVQIRFDPFEDDIVSMIVLTCVMHLHDVGVC